MAIAVTFPGFLDYVPGCKKVIVENLLVIQSKRKHEVGEEEVCNYIKHERRPAPQNFFRKFRLPENCNSSAIIAKCENGIFKVAVEKPCPKEETLTFGDSF
ncbi:hypothetical protein RJ640_021414 [Escallonia rubra]|uniref:SHSP domain-containing protein n=1 Tax=Escallonia rubra TaxID=112253 RepID=A0AA88QUW3_9ASTE|nr:hypothetical protein RJ640_021414 [Escallonia rubra]